MQIDIRRGTLNDASLLSHLSTVTFLDTFRGTCKDEEIEQFVQRHFNVDVIYKELQDKNDFYFIAFANDQPAGYIRMKEEESDVAQIKKYKSIELKRIYVLKEYHDKKVGAALMHFVLQFAAEKNYEAVWLGVWEHNTRAQAFYKKWGFTDTGETHDFPIGDTPQMDNWLIKLIA
jgi:ribosomal protein S18 acetylase RimI-like enzyme